MISVERCCVLVPMVCFAGCLLVLGCIVDVLVCLL